MNHFHSTTQSPIGRLHLIADSEALVAIIFDHEWRKAQTKFPNRIGRSNAVLKRTQKQLKEYFSGRRRNFDLPIRFTGTKFQVQAWQTLCRIPFGTTKSYQEQARLAGRPRAVRAVGGANGRNPLPIVVPCHRVIGKSGKLTGYGGGLKIKNFLLNHEDSK